MHGTGINEAASLINNVLLSAQGNHAEPEMKANYFEFEDEKEIK